MDSEKAMLKSSRLNLKYKHIIFNAAKEGKVYRLKVFLDHKSEAKIAEIVSSHTNGTTPLMIACSNGHIEVVVYLIKRCHANVDQGGSVSFHGEVLEDVTPLWCAAAAGRLNLIRLLVKFKASLNKATKSGITPLHAAILNNHLHVIKYLVQHGVDVECTNSQGYTPLMMACSKTNLKMTKFLIDSGADLNKQSEKGATALHKCVETGYLENVALLLRSGAALLKDSSGFTPMMTAALFGNVVVTEYIIRSVSVSKADKIDALDILGASLVDKKRDIIQALSCWNIALQLRYEDRTFHIPKPKDFQSLMTPYINVKEFHTFSQLQELHADPEAVRMQALLVRERILGIKHPITSFFIRQRGISYANAGDYDKCVKVWFYALDIHQKIHKPLSKRTQFCLFDLAELFSFMLSDNSPFLRDNPCIPFNHILHVFQKAMNELKSALSKHTRLYNSDRFHQLLIIIMVLIGFMCQLKCYLNNAEEHKLKQAAYDLIHLNPMDKNGWTPLHLASFYPSLGTSHIFGFPSSKVVDLLLSVGACPNVFDFNRNTPLHIAAKNNPCDKNVLRSFLKHGSHLDLCNIEKESSLHLIQSRSLLNINPLQYVNLQCLSARAIKTYNIPYQTVHKQLQEFVDAH